MFRATVRMDGPVAEAAVESIGPESDREPPRTRSLISFSDEGMVATIEAEDASAMRAALNSFLECITVVQSVENIAKARK